MQHNNPAAKCYSGRCHSFTPHLQRKSKALQLQMRTTLSGNISYIWRRDECLGPTFELEDADSSSGTTTYFCIIFDTFFFQFSFLCQKYLLQIDRLFVSSGQEAENSKAIIISYRVVHLYLRPESQSTTQKKVGATIKKWLASDFEKTKKFHREKTKISSCQHLTLFRSYKIAPDACNSCFCHVRYHTWDNNLCS